MKILETRTFHVAVKLALDLPLAVDVSQRAFDCRGDKGKPPAKKTSRTPAPESRVYRAARTKALRQVTPGNAGAQNVEHGRDHEPVVPRRSIAQPPSAGFAAHPVNYLAVATTAQANPIRRSVSWAGWDRHTDQWLLWILRTRPSTRNP
jgi:hypothetical protein